MAGDRLRARTNLSLGLDLTVGLGVTGAILVVRWLLNPWLDDGLHVVLTFSALLPLAVIVRPSTFLAAAMVSFGGTWLLLLPAERSLVLREPGGVVAFCIVGLGVAATVVTAYLSRRQRERARAESEGRRKQLELVTDATPALISYVDRDERYRFVNRYYEQWFGVPREEVLGKTMTEVLGADSIRPLRPHLDRALRGEQVRVEAEVPYPRSGTRWIDANYVPNRDARGNVLGFFTLVSDITERKDVEKRLLEADRRKDEFLATLAHELRNPLAPIRTAADVLKSAREDPERFERLRATIERQSAHLVRLLDDLMDVSRIKGGKVTLRQEQVDLGQILEQASESVKGTSELRGQIIDVDLPTEPITVQADPVRLAQIIGNLLSNACKYTDRGGHIWLSAERQGPQATIRVKDTGIGVDQKQLSKIFDMFAQVEDSLHRAQGGLGIGLSLARSLVDMHGGSLEARSAGLGKGSEFIVRLPILESAAVSSVVREKNGVPVGERRRVLVVDDNEDALSTLAMLLEIRGHEVQTAQDGEQAFVMAESFKPEVVLLDIGLPIMDGYEVARKIRREPWGAHIRLVAMTGWGQERDKQMAAQAGFDAHATKPASSELLERLIGESDAFSPDVGADANSPEEENQHERGPSPQRLSR